MSPRQVVATTIITYEEQTRGWLSYMGTSRSLEAQVEAYRQLQQHLNQTLRKKIVPKTINNPKIIKRV
ncbi:hypothetical protein [Kamptonema formosum]|nr:hypothetical protein [Kamptonema formosum]